VDYELAVIYDRQPIVPANRQSYNSHDLSGILIRLMRQEADSFCVRDAFLLSVNLPTFGALIANTIEKVNNIDA